jgi:hypothetical protein
VDQHPPKQRRSPSKAKGNHTGFKATAVPAGLLDSKWDELQAVARSATIVLVDFLWRAATPSLFYQIDFPYGKPFLLSLWQTLLAFL